MNYIHDDASLEQIRRRLHIEPGHVRRLRNAFYKKHQPPEEAIRLLPEPQHAALRNEVTFHVLTLGCRHDSQLAGASPDAHPRSC